MRFALIALLALAACDNTPPKHRADVHVREIENLTDSDRGELIVVRGVVAHVADRGPRQDPRVAFLLQHGDHELTVVSKGVLPETFREGVTARVTGRWVATEKVRDDLDRERFTEVRSLDVFLARDVIVEPPSF